MNYKLAKKLKDAGFPQDLYENSCHLALGKTKGKRGTEWMVWVGQETPIGQEWYKVPTLSELIKAIPKTKRQKLFKDATVHILQFELSYNPVMRRWETGYIFNGKYALIGIDKGWYKECGKTPEDAVANFWLKINEIRK